MSVCFETLGDYVVLTENKCQAYPYMYVMFQYLLLNLGHLVSKLPLVTSKKYLILAHSLKLK